MKKFVFTLQTVYDMALSTEKQQKLQIKRLEDRLRQLNEELSRMKEQYLDVKERCAKEMERGMASEELAQYSLYFESLINRMIEHREQIARAEQEKEIWVQRRIQTRKEIQTYDKLRETQYEEYLHEVKREEEKEIGDLVSFQVASK